LLKSLPKILSTIRRTIDRDAAYILRIPATIPIIYSIILKIMGIRFAVEVAADPYDGYSRASLNSRLAHLYRAIFVWFTKWQCREAFASAYVTREVLQRRYPPRCTVSSFSFTSIDLRPEAFVKMPRRAEDFDISAPHLVMIGNMQKSLKGHDTLLEAIRILKESGLNVRATIIGFGENRSVFEVMAEALGLAGDVHFTGKLQNGGPVRAVLDTADVFVLPSRQEGLPRALLEAMARALPAVASRIGGTPELLQPEHLFEPNEADQLAQRILEMVADAETLANASRQNFEVACGYRADIVTQRRDEFCRYIAGELRMTK